MGTAVENGKPYIEFDGSTQRFSGYSGCNRIAGSYRVNGNQLKLSQGVMTKRACVDKKIQKVETAFMKGLNEVTGFQIQGDVLRLLKRSRPILTLSTETKA